MRALSRIGPCGLQAWCWVVGAGSAPLVVGTRWSHTHDDGYSEKKFVDHVIVQARAGNGGQGCASVQKGRSRSMKFQPDGGNGGDGGDVVLRASREVKSLAGLPQLLVSSHGGNGTSKKQHGRRGSDGLYLVPLGTRVRAFQERSRFHKKHSIEAPPSMATEDVNDMDMDIGATTTMAFDLSDNWEEEEEEEDAKETVEFEYMQDLLEHGDEIVVAKGGHGGKGNSGYVSKRHRMAQQQAAASTFGESVRLELEMKLISDFSLVGFPNVGKSSLLRSISAAVPKVGAYAFTTTTPQLGSVKVGWNSFLVSDVPGLVQGAHANRGVGHRFLRHVERTNIVVYVLDASGSFALQKDKALDVKLKPAEQFLKLREELGAYSSELLGKKHMIVLNKIDLVRNKRKCVDEFTSWFMEHVSAPSGSSLPPVLAVSATGKTNAALRDIDNLMNEMKLLLYS
ncbi:hypothetical protein M9434_003427 [Picochlorum sp. BPE23]|nr:hypothetical protein M9434_003427 [Picochlorum sp. BPE23]